MSMSESHFNDLRETLQDRFYSPLDHDYPPEYRQVAKDAIDQCIATIGDFLTAHKAAMRQEREAKAQAQG